MSKYGEQKHRDARRDTKRQIEKFERELLWKPDPKRKTDETVDRTPVGVTDRDQITQRVVKYAGTNEIVEFAITYAKRTSGEDWNEVLCIDTCHRGTVHRHRNGDHENEPEHILSIREQADLHHAFWDAIDEIYDAVDWGGNE